jgi:phage terminase large subunit GpA-like protein
VSKQTTIVDDSYEADRQRILATIPSYRKRIPYILSFLLPPPKITISEWADQKRILTSEDSPEAGRWVTAKAPYQKEPMDVLGNRETEQTVLQWASQTGKTAGCILNTIGYYIDVDPAPMLLVYPTVTLAERVSRQRVSPMIRNCPSLRQKIYRTTWRGMDRGTDSLLMKSFPGGMMILGGAEKPASLSQFPMRLIFLDEIDRYKGDVGEEGDPVRLAITRASNFWNRKIILSSTPTLKNNSRIEFAYENSSQGRWHLPCPNHNCGAFQELRWNQIDYTNYGGKVVCKCKHCGEAYSKVKWLSGTGKWVHKYPTRKIKGYFLNALPSPWVDWTMLVEEWVEANRAKRMGDTSLLKVFINTRLAETFEDYAVRVESHVLYDRREQYEAEIPDGVLCLTVGVDIQDIQKRINYEIVGWGRNYESWGVEYGTILADPREKEWHDLFDSVVFNRIFRFSDGRGLRIRKGLIDANGAVGPYIYYYTKRRQPRLFSCKGNSHEQGVTTSFTGSYKLDLKYNTTWYPINTIMGKDELFQRLLVVDVGTGYCHFPCGANDEDERGYTNDYFIGLTSEQKHESVNDRGYAVFKYKKEGASRSSGEPLDCRNYARAALELVEQTMPLSRMVEPDFVLRDEGKGTKHPFFDANEVRNAQKQQKQEENYSFSEEIEENGRKITKMIKNDPKKPLESQFGSFGTKLANFDPYAEL